MLGTHSAVVWGHRRTSAGVIVMKKGRKQLRPYQCVLSAWTLVGDLHGGWSCVLISFPCILGNITGDSGGVHALDSFISG